MYLKSKPVTRVEHIISCIWYLPMVYNFQCPQLATCEIAMKLKYPSNIAACHSEIFFKISGYTVYASYGSYFKNISEKFI